jgi:hypothetical protein
MTRHYTCAQLLEQAHALLTRIHEDDLGWQDDSVEWATRYEDWKAEQRLAGSD